MPFESKVYNYNLPKESINQTPYKDPNLSKLLIADTKKIIQFKDISSVSYTHLTLPTNDLV